MKKLWSGAILAVMLMLLSGCIFRTPDELYQLPQHSPGYEELTKAISEVKRGLELEFSGTTVEPAVIYSGDNTSTIQLQDLDSDGEPETAVTFLRVPGAELPLRIYFFAKQPDESYEVSCVVEGHGTAIYAVDYEELSGEGKKELVVSWQTSTNMYHLGVYSLENTHQQVLEQPSNSQLNMPAKQLPEATELMSTTYSGYSLLDIDQDTCTELAVIRIDPAGTNNLVELYGWRDGTFASLGTTRLSTGITLTRVRSNFVTDRISALYITGTLMNASQTTDIVVWRDDRLVNLTLNPETGVSNENILGYNISPSDVNNDTILETPRPHLLPSYKEGGSSNFWLIDWSQYSIRGKAFPIFTTYHNTIDNWYFEIPDFWVDQMTMERDDSVSGERAVVFYHWNGQDQEPTPFLVIYKLTGVNRTIRAAQAGRFILSEDDSTIYAASLLASKWDCGLDETGVRDRFHRMSSGWTND